MTRSLWFIAGLVVIALQITACSPGNKPPAGNVNPSANIVKPAPPPPSAAPSTVQGIVEDMAGKTSVDAGRRAQDKIRAVSAERNKDLEESMGK